MFENSRTSQGKQICNVSAAKMSRISTMMICSIPETRKLTEDLGAGSGANPERRRRAGSRRETLLSEAKGEDLSSQVNAKPSEFWEIPSDAKSHDSVPSSPVKLTQKIQSSCELFDPNLASPPNEFIQNLQLRMNVYFHPEE